MREHGESGTSIKTPGNDLNPHCEDDQHFNGDPRGDQRDDWMTGGGRGRRRAMMAMMMRDPSGMDHGRFGFGGRGGRGHGGWFGFGRRGRGFGGRCGGGHGRSSDSSSSSSSSESDDEQHAPDDDVQGRKPHDGEVSGKEGKLKDQNQQETTRSDAAEGEKDQPSADQCCNHGYHGRRHGRGHHKHHHGKHMHHHHHHHHKTPHHHGCDMPPFPPMHHLHHDVPHCHGNRRHMAKKFFKRSMKKWYKAEKRAWKQQQGDHRCNRVQRSDGDEAVTSGCDNDDDTANPEIQGQLPPPWFFFSHDHHGCGYGGRGFCRQGKKGKKHGKRRRQCNCERPGPTEDTTKQAATDNQVDVADEVEILDDDQTPMDDVTE